MSEDIMHKPNRPPSLGRGIVAVLAGVLVIVILSVGTDAVLHAIGIFPQPGQMMSDRLFLLATAYRTAYGVAGGYITARLAPSRPMQHALVLGAVGVVLGTVGAVATWNRVPPLGPHWYPLALVVLAVPQCWLGGVLHGRTQTER
jgi:uncharacterized membrane protein HdeD (DUF308 family)